MRKISFVQIETIGTLEFKETMFSFIVDKCKEKHNEEECMDTITYKTGTGMEIELIYFDGKDNRVMIQKSLWNAETKELDYFECNIYRNSEKIRYIFRDEDI